MSAFSDAVLALSPSSYWRFDSGSLADSGSAGITLTAVGSPVSTASLVPSEASAASNAYDLDGTNHYFTGGNNYGFSGAFGTQKHSLMFWIRIDSTTFGTGFQRIISKRNTADPFAGWFVYGSGADGAADITSDFDVGATEEGSTADLTLGNGQTAFIVVTWDSSVPAQKIYKDGTLIENDTTGFTTAIPTTTGNLNIGAERGGSNKFNGVIDDVAVWDGTVLSAANVTTLWTAANVVGGTYFTTLGIS